MAQIARKVEKVHVTVGYKKAMLAHHVTEHGAHSVLNTEGQSNSWWIYNTLMKHLDEPVCVLTCDNVVDIDIDLLESDYVALGQPPCMLVPVVPVPGLEGDFIFHRGQVVTRIDRHRRSATYCSGIQILNPRQINVLTSNEGDFYSVWSHLIGRERLFVSSIYPKTWFAVDTLGHLVELNRLTASKPPRE